MISTQDEVIGVAVFRCCEHQQSDTLCRHIHAVLSWFIPKATWQAVVIATGYGCKTIAETPRLCHKPSWIHSDRGRSSNMSDPAIYGSFWTFVGKQTSELIRWPNVLLSPCDHGPATSWSEKQRLWSYRQATKSHAKRHALEWSNHHVLKLRIRNVQVCLCVMFVSMFIDIQYAIILYGI